MSSLFSRAASDDNLFTIQNTPKCAAEFKKPSNSVFLSASLRNAGIMLNTLAKQLNQNPEKFVGDGLQFYKIKLNLLTETIFNGLNSGQLGFVKTQKRGRTPMEKPKNEQQQ